MGNLNEIFCCHRNFNENEEEKIEIISPYFKSKLNSFLFPEFLDLYNILSFISFKEYSTLIINCNLENVNQIIKIKNKHLNYENENFKENFPESLFINFINNQIIRQNNNINNLKINFEKIIEFYGDVYIELSDFYFKSKYISSYEELKKFHIIAIGFILCNDKKINDRIIFIFNCFKNKISGIFDKKSLNDFFFSVFLLATNVLINCRLKFGLKYNELEEKIKIELEKFNVDYDVKNIKNLCKNSIDKIFNEKIENLNEIEFLNYFKENKNLCWIFCGNGIREKIEEIS